MTREKNGILIVDKPQGWTSFDVLAKLRGVLGTRKLGHSGTLDPLATGVLVVFIGRATAAADRQLNHDKTYEATIRFGIRTNTGDITGDPLETSADKVDEQLFQKTLSQFIGEQMQLPPMYSAVKINGQPLYKAARRGENIERTPRSIAIYELEYLSSLSSNDYRVRISCSKGTYIRVLAEDIGNAMGIPATLADLRRTQAGEFYLSQSHKLTEIIQAAEKGEIWQNGWILPVDSVFAALPKLTVGDRVRKHLMTGCPTSHFSARDGRYRVYDQEQSFLGLAVVMNNVLQVEKLFCERD